jgi:hypothetical protein
MKRSGIILGMLPRSGIILGMLPLLINASAFDTYLNSNNAFAQENAAASITSLNNNGGVGNFTSIKGNIVSLQNDESIKVPWILSGDWKLKMTKSSSEGGNQTRLAAASFNSSFNMVKVDGTASHKHKISDFKLTDVYMNNKTTTLNGTTTFTTEDGPNSNIPISIKIIDKSVISIWLDPIKVNRHFGSTPIYGTFK